MEFCELCGSIMAPLEEGVLKCSSCGSSKEGIIVSMESIVGKEKVNDGVVEELSNPFANYPHTCKKCGFDKAQIIMREPYVSDEDSLLYLKCGKCGFSQNMAKKIG